MAPDIEWYIGSEAGEQTVAKTAPSPKPPRRRRLVVALIVLLGIGLGVAYSSIPSPPAPAPTPTIVPTPQPIEALAVTIDREAQALADGRLQNFMQLQDPDDIQWRFRQLNSFKAWGHPPEYTHLYTVIDSGTLTTDRAWADISQFRDGQFFRETRFYRLQDGRWLRTQPADSSFWGEEQTAATAHFTLIFRERDATLAPPAAQAFEQAYMKLCTDLGCDNSLPSPVSLTLDYRPEVTQATLRGDNEQITFTLPSPRVQGLYLQTLYYSAVGRNETIDRLVYGNLALPMAYAVSGGDAHWTRTTDGYALALAVGDWVRYRLGVTEGDSALYRPELLASQDLPALEALWTWPVVPTAAPSRAQEMVMAEASALIAFIDQTYKPERVIELLHVLPRAQSLSQAIQLLGLPYDEFRQQWQDWLQPYRPDQPSGGPKG